MKRPDVLLDARQTSHMSVGMAQYARELVARLPAVAPDLCFATVAGGDNFDLAEQIGIPLHIARRRPRLAHFLTPYAPLVVPARYVVTIHDLIDLRFPQFASRKARWYFGAVVRGIARRAAAVITDDEATARDLVALYGLRREGIAVIPLGVDLAPCRPVSHARPYVIYAGNRRGHKDVATLVEGWRRTDPTLPVDLVLTGERDPALAAERERGEVVFLGDLPHDAVMGWVAGAAALVHPALAEGFGLPMLEAMRLGTPVIACTTAIPAVLRPHATPFAPGDRDGLARLIEAALRGVYRERAAGAQAATRTLTWDRCARATAELYRRLLAA